MDPLVLLFLLLIVVVSGLIGILADNLGRKLGKQRLSLWKLRPKHTARVGTFLAGMVTSTVTILLVFAVSGDVRQWILEGRKAIQMARVLNDKNRELQVSAKTMQGELSDLASQKANLNQSLLRDEKTLVKVQGSLKDAEKRYSDATRREQAAQARVAVASAALQKTALKLTAESKRLQGVRVSLKNLNGEFTYLNRDYKDLQKRDIELTQKNVDLGKLNSSLTANLQALQKTSDELSKELAADQRASEQAKADLDKAHKDLDDGKSELAKIQEQVGREEAALVGYQQVAQAARTQPLIFAQGEELARVQLQANADRKTVVNAVTRLLREARVAATKRGAAPLHSTGESAGFVAITVNGASIQPDEQEEAIISRLVNEPHDVVLLAQALFNSFRGEFIAIDVHGYNNPLIFKRRQVVATTRINGRLSRERLLSQLSDFIKNGVAKNALAAGMIPVEGSAGLLDVPPATTLAVVEQLAASGRMMRVQAVTTTDTRAADRLELEFVLK